jgi:group II intron reverse transcriptase/maturase
VRRTEAEQKGRLSDGIRFGNDPLPRFFYEANGVIEEAEATEHNGESIEKFEANLKDNLFKIWNRMSSGGYFPPPVKAVEIPKKNGGVRILGIPTVADRIAQMTAKLYFEPMVEPSFHPDSYGYRPGKSAIDAVRVTRTRCWRYDWVVEFDIKGLFDNIDHELLMKAVRKHTDCPWVILYIERWLTYRGCSMPPLEGGSTTMDTSTSRNCIPFYVI